MSTRSEAPERSPAEPEPGRVDHPASTLRGVLVEYEGRPDRRTICPRSPTRDELVTAWLTADASVFYDLAEIR